MPKRHPPPPFTLTSDIVTLVADIAERVGRLSAQPDAGIDLRLRRINRIRTIAGSLGIRDALPEAGARTRVEMRVQTRVKTPEQILALLREHPHMSLSDVAQTLGRAPSTVERAVAKLQAEQRLRFDGPKKGGRWTVL